MGFKKLKALWLLALFGLAGCFCSRRSSHISLFTLSTWKKNTHVRVNMISKRSPFPLLTKTDDELEVGPLSIHKKSGKHTLSVHVTVLSDRKHAE